MRTRHVPCAILASASLLLALVSLSCSSVNGPGSAGFASVTIPSHSPEEIATATVRIFRADGYKRVIDNSETLTFEKEASRATTLSREGLVDTYYGARTLNRVKVQIEPLGGGTHRLQCEAFLVTGGSDPFFQNEVRVGNVHSRSYQTLLNKVQEELK